MGGAPIVRSIWTTVAALMAVQLLLYAAVLASYGLDIAGQWWFLPATAGTHAAMGAALSVLRDAFRVEPSQRPLDRVNLANVLSLSRLSSAPTILWLVLLGSSHRVAPVLVPLAVVVFLTDLADGEVSRRAGQVTVMGKYLDSTSDYMILTLVALALLEFRLLSRWVFLVLMARFGVQVLCQVTLFAARGGRLEFSSSTLGKTSIFSTMTLFAAALLQLAPLPEWYGSVYGVLEYVAAGIALVAIGDKVAVCVGNARRISGDRGKAQC